MKTYLLLTLAMLLAMSACENRNKRKDNGKTAVPKEVLKHNCATCVKNKISWDAEDIVAVAFLGYYDDIASMKESKAYSDMICNHLVEDAPVVGQEGEEYYLVIPRDSNAVVSVNAYTKEMFLKDEDPTSGKLLYQGSGTPFFLRCNFRNAMPNTNMTIKDSKGNVLKYSVQVDLLKNELVPIGTVLKGVGAVKDITEKIR